MSVSPSHPSRREFVKAAGGAAMAASLLSSGVYAAPGASKKIRYAIVGTGIRANRMWGTPIARDFSDVVEFVGLCDVNPKRVEVARQMYGVACPTFTDFDEMCDKARPDAVMVSTVDCFHGDYIINGLKRGIQVITEKPMVTDEAQCQAVLDAERSADKKIVVTFNCRYIPKFQAIKEVLLKNPIGKIISVDFNWYLNTSHGGEYMRRWHRLRDKSGTLLVHKSTHHFDLVNWFLDADPVDVAARGGLDYFGKNNPYRHRQCRGCPHKDKCKFYWDITKDAEHKRLFADCEDADGYIRDGCVWDERIDIYDTMNAVITYSNGVRMTYSLNAFLPMEGIRLAFNGTGGRFEVRIFDKQSWKVDGDEAFIAHNFGQREEVQLPQVEGAHGGGDERLREVVFRNPELPAHMRLPDSRAGAMSCLTGIAARKSIEQDGKTVRIADLVKFG